MNDKSFIFNRINKTSNKQHGATLMVLMVIMVVAASSMLVTRLASSTPRQLEQDRLTNDALSAAKEALIGYSIAVDLNGTSKRPGDLPCPDNHPPGDALEGTPSTPCNSNALGRLPWKTLGLPDLRDGSGERLWYAVSTNFKNANRTGTLNSDTPGTISLYSPTSSLINDATAGNGVVAVIIAPGAPLTRLDTGSMQDRSSSGNTNPVNYLDTPQATASPLDNAAFSDASLDGFIQGPVKDANGVVSVNDRLLTISQGNIMLAMHKRVLGEVRHALLEYYCGMYNVDNSGNCISASGGNRQFPLAASFSDSTCLGTGQLASCNPSASNKGRLPANPSPAWDTVSILSTHAPGSGDSWFQKNSWREVIYYAVDSSCTGGGGMGGGGMGGGGCSGNLTLNRPPASPATNLKLVLIAAGSTISGSGQLRSTSGDKTTLSNYLEGENISPLDDIFTTTAASPFNDIAAGYP